MANPGVLIVEDSTTTEAKRRETATKVTQCLRNLDNLVNDMLCFVGGARADGDSIVVLDLLQEVFSAIAPQLDDCSYVTALPADVANEMIAGNAVTEAIVGNFYEVMNISSKLMMSDSSAHLRLDKTLNPKQSAEAIAALQESAPLCQKIDTSMR